MERMRYELYAPAGGTSTYYIDLAQSLSLQTRKLHRQHRVYTVLGGLLSDSNQDASITINTAPHTWVTRTAIRRGFRMWQKMVRQHTSEADTKLSMLEGKWADWKIYLDAAHEAGGANALPRDGSTPSQGISSTGEWSYSRYVSEDINWASASLLTASDRNADEFYAHIVGEHSGSASNWTSIGLIKSWIETRPQPQATPNISPSIGIGDDPLSSIFDEADAQDEVLENLTDDNDEPPYDEDTLFGYYPAGGGTMLQRQAMAFCTSANRIVPVNGFHAIHGLLQVNVTSNLPQAGNVTLLLDVDPQGVKV